MLALSDNLCRLMLSIYDESGGTTKPVNRSYVLSRLNQRKDAANEDGRVTPNTLSSLIATLVELQLVRRASYTEVAALVDVDGFRAYIIRKIVKEFCAGSTLLLIEPVIQVIGAHNLKRHLHEH